MGTASSLESKLAKFLADPEVPAETKALVQDRLGSAPAKAPDQEEE